MISLAQALNLVLLFATPVTAEEDSEAGVSQLAGKNVLSQQELDRLPFTHLFFAAKEAVDAETEKALHDLDLGVWLTRKEYRSGEPIQALFVVKNRGPRRGLDMWLTLTARGTTTWNEARLQLMREDKDGRHQRSHIYSCGGPPLSVVDKQGYLCMRGELESGLTPGQYTLSWSYRRLRSNEVRFRVLEEKAPPGPKSTLSELSWEKNRWLSLDGKMTGHDQPGSEPREAKFVATRIGKPWFENMARSLAAGHNRKYYPDALGLPTEDDGLKVSARIIGTPVLTAKSKPSLELRLEPTARASCSLRGVDFHLALLVVPLPGATSLEQDAVPHGSAEGKDSAAKKVPEEPFRDLTIRLDLPSRLPKYVPFRGPARIAVVLTARPIMDRTHFLRVEERLEVVRVGKEFARVPSWDGILRSPWLEVDFAK